MPLWKLLGGHDPAVPCYAGGIDLHLSVDDLVKEHDANLKRGFRAIKMKVGRKRMSEDVARIKALRAHLGDGFPLMVDANMAWTADEAIRRARAFQPFDLVWLEEPIIPDDVAGHARVVARGRRADRDGREPALALRVQGADRGGRRELSRARCHQLRRRHACS